MSANTPTVTVADLPGGTPVVDVREQDEWDAGHIEGALHIPLGDIPSRLSELPDEEVAVICHSGGRSARATDWLVAQGRAARSVTGGMSAWEQAGRPMRSENGQPPHVD